MKPIAIAVDSGIRGVKMKKSRLSEQGQSELDYNFQICILASGSRGNAVYVSGGSTSILIDAGLSGIEIERRLNSKGIYPEDLDAIVVSHEHTDHIQGVGVLSRRFNLPIYMSAKTEKASVSHLRNVRVIKNFECGSPFTVKDLSIHPFSISHDAEDPSGFTVNQNGTKVGIATDLGIATSMVKEHLKGCSLLILEANHDEDMLRDSTRPWSVKQRIAGRQGHLSNLKAAELLCDIASPRLHSVFLAHLSQDCNRPELAKYTVSEALRRRKLTGIRLHMTYRNSLSELVEV